MKRILLFITAAISIALFVSCATTAELRNDVIISLDQLDQDAAIRQFKKANKSNQLEIIRGLIDEANNVFYNNCKTEEDLNELQEKLTLITWYHDQAKDPSVNITSKINDLAKKIETVKRKVSGGNTIIIDQGVKRDAYRHRMND